jgi:glucose/arabinose dehydrogenase/mono/diheme cytochrome c family protein
MTVFVFFTRPISHALRSAVRRVFPAWILLALGLAGCDSGMPRPDRDNGGLVLPGGFSALVVTDSIDGGARHLAISEWGDIYVKLRIANRGGNAALRDTDGDGRADILEKFGQYPERGNYGTAMRIHDGYLYFSSQLVVYRFRLDSGVLAPQGEPEIVLTDDHPHGGHEHVAKPVAFDGRGYMYVPFGAPSNACQELNRTPYSPGRYPCPDLLEHGGIWRFEAGKTGLTQRDGELFATGLRSVMALGFNPSDGELYAVMHGRDDLLRLWPNLFTPWQSALLPSEELFRISEGMDAGWPYCYYDQLQEKKVLAPEYGGDGNIVGGCDSAARPLIGFPGHWAPNDLLFYRGSQFPARYREGAFVAFHGSTNRAPYPQSGYFVAFIPFENGAPNGRWEVFADGFAGVDPIVNVSDAVHRPMGLAEGPDGSLYICDSNKGKIWRILYRGKPGKFGPAQLAALEMRKMRSNIRTPHEQDDVLGQETLSEEARLYTTYCSACHQGNGLGAPGRFPPLAGSDWVTGDPQRLIRVVLEGLEGPIEVNGEAYNGFMPPHAFLSDAELASLLSYVRNNFGNSAPPVSVEEVRALRPAEEGK